jgi:flagellar motor switch protein FliG
MGVYTRFKRTSDGFRKLVELLETTPAVRRKKMIDVGMAEDPDYTERALALVLNFEDILNLPEMELAELCGATQPRTLAIAISQQPAETKDRFVKCCKLPVAVELRDYLGMEVKLREVGAAQLKVIEVARSLERKGFLKTKRIPLQAL